MQSESYRSVDYFRHADNAPERQLRISNIPQRSLPPALLLSHC